MGELHRHLLGQEGGLQGIQEGRDAERKGVGVEEGQGPSQLLRVLPCCGEQTLRKEMQGHEPRIAELGERQRALGAAAAGPELAELQAMWERLGRELELRGKRLEEALRAQQFYRDAAEAEAWMGEQELHMMGQEKAKVRPGRAGPAPAPLLPGPLPDAAARSPGRAERPGRGEEAPGAGAGPGRLRPDHPPAGGQQPGHD